jgi:hypothetical protein
LVSRDGVDDVHRQLDADEAAPSGAEQRSASDHRSGAATPPVDPVAAALETALELRRAGADARALRRVLRLIEELLDA